ncbi:uncharacterized protein LOC123471193 [Daphnia magna]|uniref:uncharacterized protein LOC123471193 n=1 Tax=Daphnia magna TaxID=35525 RepID=UPI001E1BBBC6|nr:uncharacterized protein LOC123471193 [Daphnia magna]
MTRLGAVNGLKLNKEDEEEDYICEGCIFGAMKRSPFKAKILGLDEEIQEELKSTIPGTSDEGTSADNKQEENHETHTEAQEIDQQELDMAENRRQEEINQAHEKVQEIDRVEINNETGGGEEPIPEIGAEIEIQIEQEEPRRRKQQRPKDKTTRTPPVPNQIDPQADDETLPVIDLPIPEGQGRRTGRPKHYTARYEAFRNSLDRPLAKLGLIGMLIIFAIFVLVK